MLVHLKAVRRGVERALLVADMPYGSYHTGMKKAVENALLFIKEGGAEAVKIEGGRKRARLVERLSEAEIARLEDDIRAITREIMKEAAAAGDVEFVHDVTSKLPSRPSAGRAPFFSIPTGWTLFPSFSN